MNIYLNISRYQLPVWARSPGRLGLWDAHLATWNRLLDRPTHLGSIWDHPGSFLAPQASRSLPRLNQTIPRGAQRLPEPKSHKHAKVTPLQIEILVTFLPLVSGGLILFG